MPNDAPLCPPAGNEFGRVVLAVLNSGTGVWDRDVVTGRILYSTEWKAMLGYADAEVSDRIEDSYTRVHPDDLAQVRAAIQDHFDSRTPSYVVEHRLRCKDGSYKWVLSRGRVVSRDKDGKPLRMTGVTTDISDTVALSERVRHSAELLTHLTDEVPGLVYQYQLDPDGRAAFTYTSAGIATIFGVSRAQAAADAAAVESLIHPDDIDTYRGSLAVSADTLERWHLEFRVILPGVGERWREANAKPRRLENGGTVWHGFVSDISAHKQLEQQLHDAAATDFLTGLPK
jgi:PAS domain S-box-containing protein